MKIQVRVTALMSLTLPNGDRVQHCLDSEDERTDWKIARPELDYEIVKQGISVAVVKAGGSEGELVSGSFVVSYRVIEE